MDVTNHLRFNLYEMFAQDTWRIRNTYGPDEYVGAAVQIYLDLLNLFLALLRILGGRRS